MTLNDAIDTVFSHNEIVSIWKHEREYDILLWHGMAHEIPKEYLSHNNWRIFGTIPEKISSADTINIRLYDKN